MNFTKTDEETLLFIKDYIENYKLAPTFGEIAEHFNLKGRSIARARVLRLKEQGFVNFTRQNRSIVLLDYDYKLVHNSHHRGNFSNFK